MKIIISGGLGNQMFQYALYKALRDKGRNVTIDTSLFSYTKMHNGFELEKCFGLTEQRTNYSSWYLLKLRAARKFKLKFIVYNDPLCFKEKIFKTKRKYLYGSWQSEKYFDKIEDDIRNLFSFKTIDVENKKIAIEMGNQTSIAVHIRRGDYSGNDLYAGICTEEYYSKAISLIFDKIKYQKRIMFYIFSDDKEFAANFIRKYKVPSKLIEINKGVNSYKDMYLMSNCKHNIIANSSFSWWGAWLNVNPDKIVIAPNRWFGKGSEENYKDIVPFSWEKI
ncbi:MAG: alpha-1,2-fucosyltransferase [Bacteroidota bacterium]